MSFQIKTFTTSLWAKSWAENSLTKELTKISKHLTPGISFLGVSILVLKCPGLTQVTCTNLQKISYSIVAPMWTHRQWSKTPLFTFIALISTSQEGGYSVLSDCWQMWTQDFIFFQISFTQMFCQRNISVELSYMYNAFCIVTRHPGVVRCFLNKCNTALYCFWYQRLSFWYIQRRPLQTSFSLGSTGTKKVGETGLVHL